MSYCPVCNASVKDDFGLIECSGCGAQLIVHMDGRVEHEGAVVPLSRDGDVEPTMPSIVEELPPAEEFGREIDFGQPEVEAIDEATPSAEPEYDFENEDQPVEAAPPIYNSAVTPDSPDLSDVANFGNSDLSGGRSGSLRYNIFIEGIDTSDVREAFREALTDRKLLWDTDEILRSVRQGKVNIPNVAPTKAYILISRLRGMPVQVRWEQYAISQT